MNSTETKPEPSLGEEVLDRIHDLSTAIDEVEGESAAWQDPANFWNPGPPTLRESAKLRLLHAVAVGGGWLRPVLGRQAKGTFGILTYHRIAERRSPSRDGRVTEPTINVSPQRFAEQLSGLQRKGFEFVSLRQALHGSDSGLAERSVVVTFDDIYDNVFQEAWPVLQEFKIPATIFLSTDYIDSHKPFPFDHWAHKFHGDVPQTDWRPIQSKHLEQMLDSDLIQLGAHTHSHQDFRNRPDDFAVDLQQGIDILHQRFGRQELPFAFPYGVPRLGFANERLMEHVQRRDLTCGLTTGSHTNGIGSEPFGWGRFHVFEHDTAASLAAKLDGYYQWLPALKNRFTKS